MTLFFGTVLPWLLVAVGTWFAYQLVRQNGRILLRLESIERRIAARPGPAEQPREREGLPLGSIAPDFELPDLAGTRHKLSEFRGQDVLLMFFNPKCGFCTKMLAELAALPVESGNGRAVPVVVTTGDADENRKLVAEHGIRCLVLLQKEMEIASRFRAHGTPMGYRLDVGGRIASPLVAGADPLLQLAAKPFSASPGRTHKSKSNHKEPDPSLARSRINRSGLKAGTVAPEFTLPQITDEDLSLADLRGRRVLLVFSDPECGPCDELAPQLQELHVTRPDLQVLVISRRDADATRTKAESLGLTYPIVMQKQWELSMKYGMFATPIGYLIDEQGVLLSDVAVGVEPILGLATKTAPTTAGATETPADELETVMTS